MSPAVDSKDELQTDGLLRARPSTVGIDADAVVALLDDAQTTDLDVHSLLVYRHGCLAVEMYRWPCRADRPRVSHSVTKSFTACAIGLALAEGRFRLNDKVVSFFPEHLPPTVDEKLAAMTVLDVLTMRTGHANETSGSRWRGIKTSWIAEFFKIPVEHLPGAVYVYTSAASYMLSAILTKTTGETMHDYLKPRLFEPLGIIGETWDISPDEINPGGNGLTCKTVDLLKLGILHAQKGIWNGSRILPETWITEATRAFGDSDYGYHWVSGPDGEFYAMGLFGQLIAVFPKHDAVVVVTSAVNSPHAVSGQLIPMIHRHLMGIFQPSVLDETEADSRLAARVARMSTPEPPVSLAEPRPEHIGVRRYAVLKNALGVQEMSLDFAREVCTLRLTDPAGEQTIIVGINRWIEGVTNMRGEQLHHGYHLTPARVVAGARWLAPDTLEMTWIFTETAFRDRIVLHFMGKQFTMSRSVNVNSGTLKLPDLRGDLITP
jgi:CubicO group peptidase (beta-lactamase class C family)